MMINLLSFSQKDSIRKIVLNKDTGAFIPMNKVREINKVFINLDECEEIKDTLKQIIKNYDISYNKLDSSLISSRIDISKKDSIILSHEKIDKDYQTLIMKKDFDIQILKVQRNILLPVLGVLVLILLIP